MLDGGSLLGNESSTVWSSAFSRRRRSRLAPLRSSGRISGPGFLSVVSLMAPLLERKRTPDKRAIACT